MERRGHATLDRPLLGSGPGRYQAATSKYRPLRFARTEGPSKLYYDAHDIVVQMLVTVGLLGTAAFLVWMALALRMLEPTSPFLGYFSQWWWCTSSNRSAWPRRR